ncbi:DgyrCDS2359 [Dimorphilus gyrociliatus]|uniref:DgyrCDS2359 n=1 Tax=Dimorphilus gyrociliatus TaxID=2664684 RepID=A0A7I8VA83_9ANNE|nr:DgyrCDS2359 [Dimorphilus gyrociliatus]
MSNSPDKNIDDIFQRDFEKAVLRYGNRFIEIRDDNERLRQKKKCLKSEVKSLKSQIISLQEKLENNDYIMENEILKEKNSMLKSELKALKKKYASLEEQSSDNQDNEAAMKELYEKAKERKELLRNEEKKCKLLEEFHAKLEKQIEELQDENHRLWIYVNDHKEPKENLKKLSNGKKASSVKKDNDTHNFCNFCQVLCESDEKFQHHVQQHLDKLKPIISSNFAFYAKGDNNETLIMCEVCQHSSTTSAGILKHIRNSHLNNVQIPNVCPICLLEFQSSRPSSNAQSLIRHIKTYHGRMEKCDHCKDTFINEFLRDRHIFDKHRNEISNKRKADSSMVDNDAKRSRIESPHQSFAESTTVEDVVFFEESQ